jgi:hypothetical protein
MDFCSKLMQPVAQADFINGNTLLLIVVWHFVQEQVLFNKSPSSCDMSVLWLCT